MKRRLAYTVAYIACLSILPSLLLIGVVASVLLWALWMERYESGLIALPAVAGFLAMWALFLCQSVCFTSYGVGFWAKGRREFENFPASRDTKTYRIEQGPVRRNAVTGQTSVDVRVTERRTGGASLGFLFAGIWHMVVGPVRFVIETLRVCLFPARRVAWDECRTYYRQRRAEQSFFGFFGLPVVALAVLLVGWLIIGPTGVYHMWTYRPEHLTVTVTEKENTHADRTTVLFGFSATAENHGTKEVRSIQGTLIIRDREGRVLSESRLSLGFREAEESLAPGATLPVSFSLRDSPDHESAVTLWNTPLSELHMTLLVTEIRYADGLTLDFREEPMLLCSLD